MNNNIVSINSYLPVGRQINRVTTGSELLFLFEIAKYAKKLQGVDLKLDIPVHQRVLKSVQYSYVVLNGFIDKKIDYDSLTDYSKDIKMFFKYDESAENCNFTDIEGDVLLVVDSSMEQSIFRYTDRSHAYLSFVAYLFVRAKMGKPFKSLTIQKEVSGLEFMEFVDLLIMRDYGSKVLRGMLNIDVANTWGLQPTWESFLAVNRQRGFMNREYSTSEKYKHLVREFEIGDVVLYYQRKKVTKSNPTSTLNRCYPAVIRDISKDEITLEYYPAITTRLTMEVQFSDLIEQDENRLYEAQHVNNFPTSKITYKLSDLGINKCTFMEQHFILEPMVTDKEDRMEQWFRTKEGVLTSEKLNTPDTIYAVFEDRGIDYNRDRFLAKFFSRVTPVYDKYREYLKEEDI